MVSAGGDTQTLAKSLIMAVEDIAHDWYTLFKPLSIDSWQQIKAELLSTFQSYQSGAETTRDLLNCI
jgi:exonuclease V gamma subunit